jgi:hypothetical protein
MKKLNFNEFKKKSEIIVSKELMVKINGGNADESNEDSTEGIKPLGKFGQGTKVNP